jgi:hypothetical protein
MRHDRTVISALAIHLRRQCIPPIFPFIPRRHLELPRVSKNPIFHHVSRIYRRRVLSTLHRPLYPAFLNRLGGPVAEKRLWVCYPDSTVLTVIVATRANDVGYLGIDNLFVFLVGQAINVWPRPATMMR